MADVVERVTKRFAWQIVIKMSSATINFLDATGRHRQQLKMSERSKIYIQLTRLGCATSSRMKMATSETGAPDGCKKMFKFKPYI